MSNKVSDCQCGHSKANHKFQHMCDVQGCGCYNFKPCGVKSEPVYTDRDKSINWDASETELRAEPIPSPESRLLNKEEITACYKRTKFPTPGAVEREICIAQRDLTSALVRAECQEDVIPNQDVVLMLQAKDFEIAEMKAELELKQSYVSFEFLTSQLVQKATTHKKELERVEQEIKTELVEKLERIESMEQLGEWITLIRTQALKASVIQPEQIEFE